MELIIISSIEPSLKACKTTSLLPTSNLKRRRNHKHHHSKSKSFNFFLIYGYTCILNKDQNKMMIPACFSQPNSPSSSSKSSLSQAPQNVVTCIYQTQLFNSPTYLTLSWSRTLHSHSLTIYAPDTFSITISLNSSTFSLFRTRHGSKSKSIYHQHHHKIKLQWNFNRAEYIQNSAEPDSCFYLAISCNGKVQFFLGDLFHDLNRHQKTRVESRTEEVASDPVLLSRREHVFGSKKSYVSRAVFMGCKHEIEIECIGGVLRVKVDGEVRLVVKRLAWKFRGNEKFFIDGVQVEFYWDVLSWVANTNDNGGSNKSGHGVFVFHVGDDGTVWPEMVGAEKRLMKKGPLFLLPGSESGVLQWAEESSDGGRSSSSSSTRSSGSNGGGFSLLLYAWNKN